ncbi:hypothetical protein [Streptomyces sp. LN325]|uniref:hypothetical protein n=1 Tax=Streptomyces sp. LN325 TaxID=3112976 RepID=UPI003720A60C
MTVTLVVSTALYVLCVWDRQPLPLLLYSGVPLLIVLGSGGVYFPRARYLLPGFPLLLPVALHLSRASRRHLTPARHRGAGSGVLRRVHGPGVAERALNDVRDIPAARAPG